MNPVADAADSTASCSDYLAVMLGPVRFPVWYLKAQISAGQFLAAKGFLLFAGHFCWSFLLVIYCKLQRDISCAR
jgi:hypothetical protein